MNVGMLWFDNDRNKTLDAKVQGAAVYYAKKYGRQPNLCYVHPSMLVGDPKVDGINVRPNRGVMPNHIWMGVDEQQ